MTRILVTALGHIADTLTATPVIRALRQTEPEARISVLAYDQYAGLWAADPDVAEVITLRDRRHGGARGTLERLAETVRLAPRLWRRFDTVLVLQTGAAANLLAVLTGAPRRIGYRRGAAGRLLTTAVPFPVGASPREAHLHIARALDVEDVDPRLSAWCTAADRAAVDALLRRLAPGGNGPLVALHPGSDWGCQMWDVRAWAAVGEHLARRWDARLLITGVASERGIAERIAERMTRRPAIACGETTLTQMVALVERLDLLVGVESGPVTFCVARGVPAVTLNGLYYPGERPPWGSFPGDELVLPIVERDDGRHTWYGDCRLGKLRRERGCVNPACIGRGVMGEIAPAAVIAAVDARLSGQAHAAALARA